MSSNNICRAIDHLTSCLGYTRPDADSSSLCVSRHVVADAQQLSQDEPGDQYHYQSHSDIHIDSMSAGPAHHIQSDSHTNREN